MRKTTRFRVFTCSLLAAFLAFTAPANLLRAQAGGWELSEDGYWTYADSPANPITDEWFTDEDGREYYLDSKGKMKTGWVKSSEDGCKYYMGADGAKVYNSFTPDGHYVGPDGTVIEKFDTYRKAVKKMLKKELKQGKGLDESQLSGFLLKDLNWDGYRDLLIVDCAARPERVVLAAVWNPEEEKLAVAAEADYESGEASRIVLNPVYQTTWLVMGDGDDLEQDYFSMTEGDLYFDAQWQFRTDRDDWDDLEYYVNSELAESEEWEQSHIDASEEMGAKETELEILRDFIPMKEELIDSAVDAAPTPEDLELWDS